MNILELYLVVETINDYINNDYDAGDKKIRLWNNNNKNGVKLNQNLLIYMIMFTHAQTHTHTIGYCY